MHLGNVYPKKHKFPSILYAVWRDHNQLESAFLHSFLHARYILVQSLFKRISTFAICTWRYRREHWTSPCTHFYNLQNNTVYKNILLNKKQKQYTHIYCYAPQQTQLPPWSWMRNVIVCPLHTWAPMASPFNPMSVRKTKVKAASWQVPRDILWTEFSMKLTWFTML